MPSNPWVEHVKAYAKKNNVPYMVAVKEARASYKPKITPVTPKQQLKRDMAKDHQYRNMEKETAKLI